MRHDAVQEPPVVTDHNCAAGELQERILEGTQGLDVKVVGGLVKQQQVSAHLECQRQVEPVAFTT